MSAQRTMADAETLLLTVVRTFFPTARQILAVETLIRHKALHLEDYHILLGATGKDLRSPIQPLRNARLISTGLKAEVRLGQLPIRQVQREWHYIDWRVAVDSVKYRVMKLRTRVEGMYALDQTKRKDWLCPNCKAEYDELQVLDKIGTEGFYCERCKHTLVVNEAAQRDRGSHEKIRRLNDQLSRLMDLIGSINPDLLPSSDGLFQRMYNEKIPVPRPSDSSLGVYIDADIAKGREKSKEDVKAENLQINLTSGAEHDRAEKEREEARRIAVAKQNVLPVWYSQSAIGTAGGAQNGVSGAVKSEVVGVKSEGVGVKAEIIKAEDTKPIRLKAEDDEKKTNITATPGQGQDMQDEVALYMAEMERERKEEEDKARDESEAEVDEDEDEDEDEDFETVLDLKTEGTSAVANGNGVSGGRENPDAPTSTAQVNGVKRELDLDGEESSEAATPASANGGRDAKRVKFEASDSAGKFEVNGMAPVQAVKVENDADSDEDEEFEEVNT